MKGPSWAEIDRFVDEKLARQYSHTIDRHFQGVISDVSGDGPYTCRIIRTGESVPDGNSYLCAVFAYVPAVGDRVECVWRDQHTGYVLWPLNRGLGAALKGTVLAIDATTGLERWAFPAQPVFPLGSYSDEVLIDNPVNWYRLNETVGTVAADHQLNASNAGVNGVYSGAGAGLTLAGRVGPLPHDVQYVARYNAAAGTPGMVANSTNVQTPFNTAHSLEHFVYCDGLNSGAQLQSGWGPAAHQNGDYGNSWMGFSTAGGGFNAIRDGAPLALGSAAANTWFHLVQTWNASAGIMKTYFNGAIIESLAVGTGTRATSTVLRCGFTGGTTDTAVAELATYGTELTAERILAHYDAR